jgi:hypothetical protein
MIVGAMRWTALFLLPMLASAVEIGGSNVSTIYIMPMRHGLDQYIANQLTREHVFEVTADPARADAIITDGLGDAFEQKLETLHPTPKPDVPKPAEPAKADADKDHSDSEPKAKTSSGPKTFREPDPPHTSTFGGGKGTLFLVDSHSRLILWSVYEKPVPSNPHNLDGAAKRVVNQLKQDLAGK